MHDPAEPALFPAARVRVVATAYASFVLLGWSLLLVPALIRSVEADFSRTDAELGIYYFVSAASFGIGALGGGFATERVGRRPLLAGAALLVAGGLALQGITPAWVVFVLASVPAGIGSGVIDGGMNALILDLAERGGGGALNLLHLFFSIGAAASALLVGQLVSAGLDRRSIFLATCAAAATLSLLAAVIVPWLAVSMVLFALTGLAFGPIYPMIMSIGGSLHPRRRAAVTGSLATVAVIGSTVYPPVMGFISDAASVGLAMFGAALLAAACGAALVAAGAATRRAS